MTRIHTMTLLGVLAWSSSPACALEMSDSLSKWRDGTAMDRMHLAVHFGKSFVAVNDGLTADYFLRCIDDVSTYGNAREAKIGDAVRECVAARMSRTGEADD